MFQNNLLMAAASISSAGITVDESVRYNDDDSPRLYRTPSVLGNRMTGSLSLWYKRCNLGSIQQLFNAGAGDDITFNASDKLTFIDGSVSYITTQVFRDPSAWGHLLFAWDTTLATAGDRLRIYHNGVEITAFDTETDPALYDEFEISNTVRQTIGANESDTEEFDGYLSQIYYIDGQQLTPTSFGEFDSNNVWRPIEYSAATTTTPAISHVSNDSSSVNATVFTFSSQALGAATADRRIVVAVGFQGGGSAAGATGVTVGGVSATMAVESAVDSETICSIWWAEVPTGTTGDVVITAGGTKGNCGVSCYRLTGADTVLSATSDSAMGSGAAGTGTVGSTGNSVVIGQLYLQGTVLRTTTWSGLTEDMDAVTENTISQSTASATITGSSVAVSATPSGASATEVFTLASFGSSAYGINGFFLDFADSSLLGLDAAGPAVSSTTYRYLKLDVTDNGPSTTYVSLGEMEYYVGATLYPTQTMTSNTLPSPLVASASEDTGTGSGLAYFGFDDNINTHWQTALGTVTGWLKIDLGSGNGIAPDSFRLGAPETPNRTPNGFTIQGSNNDSDWTVLATYNGFSTPTPTARTFSGYAPITTGNNFVSSGLAADDQMDDTPTTNWCTLLPIGDKGSITYSDGNLDAVGAVASQSVAVGSMAATSGKFIYASQPASLTSNIGEPYLANESYFEAGLPDVSTASNVWGIVLYTSTQWKVEKEGVNTLITHGFSGGWEAGVDFLIICFDVDNLNIWMGGYDVSADVLVFVDGSTGVTGDPGAGTNATATISGTRFTPVFDYWNTRAADTDFGQADLLSQITIPTDFKFLNTANLPTPTILDGTKNFQTTLYTGDGSVRNIDQTENSTFQPDFVWIKNRSASDQHMLIDAARGVTKEINSDAKTYEITDADGLTSFDADGFGLGTGAAGYNDNTENFVAWQWLAGGGAGSANAVGSITTTTTTVNTTAGISISTYTGTGANATVGHGLGVVPQFIMVKELSSPNADVDGSWHLYHAGNTAEPETEHLLLNEINATTDSATVWNDTSPTSTVFSLGSQDDVNQSLATYVVYVFANIEGFSSFSNYTGNGNADGIYTYTGFKPAYVMIKKTSGTGNWVIYDSQRSPYNEIDDQLLANTTAAETTGSEEIDFLSNGFKIRTADSDVNSSSGNYVYACFAEYPFGGDGATPATAF